MTSPTATRARARTPCGRTARTCSPPDQGRTGPAFNKLGGTPVGNTGLFVGDYTMQPENGGVSVFAHEFGHDLGLPDHYDTAGGDNGVEYWNLMAQSRLNGAGEALGTRAGDLSAWDKLQLGWLDYDVDPRRPDRGPSSWARTSTTAPSRRPSSTCCRRSRSRPTCGAPFAGTKQFFSGNADDLDHLADRARRPHRRP